MKRTSKKILGILALAVVAVITVVAAFMPVPGTSALETSPITDQVTVRVVGNTPKISILSPEGEVIYVDPDQILKFDFENVDTTTTKIYYTGEDKVENIYTIDTLDPNYYPGDSGDIALDLSASPYGYGEYKIAVTGVGFGGVTDEDTVEFLYLPVYGKTSENPDNGLIYLDLYYDPENEDIDHITVNVYDGDALVDALTAEIKPGTNQIELPFAENNLKSGNYTIKITAYGENGKPLYPSYPTSVDFVVTPLPDTGAFLSGINITRSDFVITAVIAFMAVSTAASVLITCSKKQKRANEK